VKPLPAIAVIGTGVAAGVGGAACAGVDPPQAVNRTARIRQHNASGVQYEVCFNCINMVNFLLLDLQICSYFAVAAEGKHMNTIIGALYHYTYLGMKIHP
jgi:hypothetical protein